MSEIIGSIGRINGPVVKAKDVKEAMMSEMVEVGESKLIGEIIRLEDDIATIQVYEETEGLKVGEPVYGTGQLLSVELGPGLLTNIFDGIQRPLTAIKSATGDFIGKGVSIPPLDRKKRWPTKMLAKKGDTVSEGNIIATIKETELIEHRVLVPTGIKGEVISAVPDGDYNIETTILTVKTEDRGEVELKLYHRWPVRHPRAYKEKLLPDTPLLTGQRVIDTFFPIAKGGTAAIPGGFGTGKTVTQHQLAKWSDAQIIVYIGCGERGNEMTEVLEEFPKLIDPHSNRPLMERTILIANTSNMPVAAREASIYTGITIAEYYRDMGYDVAIMADSTSRWAEALREIAGRLEEMPAEEGFPAYLPTKLAEFYERAGKVLTLSGKVGSITIIGAVSPPGGDFSEPVTQYTKRFTRCFWGLDKNLASARHFPSINWLESYSEYINDLQKWWEENVDKSYREIRNEAMELLQEESKLQRIVQLIGAGVLPDSQKLILEAARMIKDQFLRQNAFSEIDSYSTPEKQIHILKLIMAYYQWARRLINKKIPISKITSLPVTTKIMHVTAETPNEQIKEKCESLMKELIESFKGLESEFERISKKRTQG